MSTKNASTAAVIEVPERVHPINADGSFVPQNELAFIRAKQRKRRGAKTPPAKNHAPKPNASARIVTPNGLPCVENDHTFQPDSIRDGLLKELAVHMKSAAFVNDPLALSGALFTLASLVGNRFRLTHDDEGLAHQSLAMFFLLVGPARVTRKSTLIQNHVQIFVREVTGVGFVDECTPEAIHEELCSQGIDSMAIYFDEFRSLIGDGKQYSAGLDTAITKMYNGGPWTRSLKSNKTSKGGSTRRTVENFTVNVCSCTTPEWLFKHVSTESFLSGFLLRFITVCVQADDAAVLLDVDSPHERETFVSGLPKIETQSLLSRLKHLYEQISGGPQRKIRLSTNAQILLSQYAKEVLAQKLEEIAQAIFDGVKENIRRVAALIEISHWLDDGKPTGRKASKNSAALEVSEASMQEAIGFFRQVYPDCLRMIRQHFSTSKVEADAKILLREIWALIPKQSRYRHDGQEILGMPKTIITRGTRLSGSRREAALRELVARDILEGPLVVPSSNPKARKPLQIFVIKREQWD